MPVVYVRGFQQLIEGIAELNVTATNIAGKLNELYNIFESSYVNVRLMDSLGLTPVAATSVGLNVTWEASQPVSITNPVAIHGDSSSNQPVLVSGEVGINNFPTEYPVVIDEPVNVNVENSSLNVVVTNFPTTQAVDVTNSVDVVVTNTPLAVSVSGTAGTIDVHVDNFPSTQPVSGSVSVSNFPSVQSVSGTVNIGNFPSVQHVDVDNFPSTQDVVVTNSPTVTLDPTTPIKTRPYFLSAATDDEYRPCVAPFAAAQGFNNNGETEIIYPNIIQSICSTPVTIAWQQSGSGTDNGPPGYVANSGNSSGSIGLYVHGI